MPKFISLYGPWYGPIKEDETKCIEVVYWTWSPHQCQRKRGHGEQALFCKQHAKKPEQCQRTIQTRSLYEQKNKEMS